MPEHAKAETMNDNCIVCSGVLEPDADIAARCRRCGLLHNLGTHALDYRDGGGQAAPDAGKMHWRLVNARRRFALIAPFLRPGHRTFVDIGCGSGEMLIAARAFGLAPVGFDTNRPLIAWLRTRIAEPVFDTPFDALLIPDREQDPDAGRVFSLAHVIEHLDAPLDLVSRVRAAMRPGDLLFIEVPLATGRSFRTLGYHWNMWNPEHVALYTLPALDALAERIGLRVLSRGTRIFARGSHSGSTRLALCCRQPVAALRAALARDPLSIADRLIADYGFVVLT